MKFDLRQQPKAWIIGAVTAVLADRFGLPIEVATAVGIAVGAAVDVAYYFLAKALDGEKE